MKILKQIIPIIREHLDEVLTLRTEKEKKADDSFVSKGDLLMDQLVATFVQANFTDYTLISEETHRNETVDLDASTYIIVVDPIDGTENFVSGLREWGVGIAVYKNKQHFESLIALPELNEYVLTGEPFQRFESRIAGLSMLENY